MRGLAAWVELAAILGPLLLGVLFVPIALALFAIVQQVSRKENGPAPVAVVAGILAVVTALVIYPNHFATVEACQKLDSAITSEELINRMREILGSETSDTTAMRLEMVQRGCSNLPGFTPRST